ncbi:hypothetical protein M1770_09390 [Spiroplasma citri]|uniref:Plectrovirus-related protein n=1 Tax=Spiroplasma citri TaxID=2133 RepID=Q14L48_SPICI|nr:hypothetical protein [Spiroplasma citri]WFG98235.1 hypothetical protein M1770_09390 [Spiroplasma citri]CAK99782.1 hypothetical protein SPICI20_024 [Spiroplasma citri]
MNIFFAENTVYNQNKDQIEIEANNNLAVNNFLVNPFLAQSEINFITTIEQFNFNLVQNFIFKPIVPKVNINNNFFVNSNWFKYLTTTYRIITQQLPNYYNKEFNQDLLAQFEFDFFVQQKLVIDEKAFCNWSAKNKLWKELIFYWKETLFYFAVPSN